jgi:PhnB protein
LRTSKVCDALCAAKLHQPITRTLTMPFPTAYLSFNGTCAEAMRFYEKTLHGKLRALMRNGDSPMAEHTPKEAHHLILHAYLELPGNGVLMAGDAPRGMPYEGMKGFTLALNYETVEEAIRVFDALAEGGQIQMPMQPSFWAKRWGMVTDKFGTPWIVNGEMLDYLPK